VSGNSSDELQIAEANLTDGTGSGRRSARIFMGAAKKVHQTISKLQGDRTVEVLRYDIRERNPRLGVRGRSTQVTDPDLSALPCTVSSLADGEVMREGERVREQLRTFTIYNVPEWQSMKNSNAEPIARITKIDQLVFRGALYDVVNVAFDEKTGRNTVVASLRLEKKKQATI